MDPEWEKQRRLLDQVNRLREEQGLRRRAITGGPMHWDDMIRKGGNTNMESWHWDGHTAKNTNERPTPKTTAEFDELDIENMSKEDIAKYLRDVLVALEESEAAWTEEHEKRTEAEQTVEKLREAGFTGGEPVVESEDEEEDHSEGLDYWPKVSAPRGGITYNTTAESAEELAKRIRDQIIKNGTQT